MSKIQFIREVLMKGSVKKIDPTLFRKAMSMLADLETELAVAEAGRSKK